MIFWKTVIQYGFKTNVSPPTLNRKQISIGEIEILQNFPDPTCVIDIYVKYQNEHTHTVENT